MEAMATGDFMLTARTVDKLRLTGRLLFTAGFLLGAPDEADLRESTGESTNPLNFLNILKIRRAAQNRAESIILPPLNYKPVTR